MIRSMTGYGKSMADTGTKKISCEIKSLNSKQLDVNVKLPWLYREKESDIRKMISSSLDRGKIDLIVSIDSLGTEESPTINEELVVGYFNQMKRISTRLNLDNYDMLLSTVMRFPDTLKSEKKDLKDEEWVIVKGLVEQSIEQLDIYRIEEGKSIERDFRGCITKITSYLAEVKNFEEERITKIRDRIGTSLQDICGADKVDNNRLEQEIIFYIEKLDINEEKSRLTKHCNYFLDTIDSSSPNGRTLNFIAQEMGREINTLGSKANDASIQKLVVKMKDELEKIKEQTLNAL